MGRILVTGAAGFIAARTTERLILEGHSVVGIDNLNDAYDVALKKARLQTLCPLKQFSFQVLDIENASALGNLFSSSKFDAVVHLAGRAGVRYSLENPHVYLATNAAGTLHVLEAMRGNGVKKIVLASTSSLYAGLPIPFVETQPVNTPISPYAASKKAAEMLAYTYHHLFGLDVTVLRYFTVYGPAGRPDMSPFRFIRWIDEGQPIELNGDGTQSRDFTYVDDIAAATISAIRPLKHEIINVGGGGRQQTLVEMIGILENLLGKRARIVHRPFHKTDMTETQADISKAHRLLGWQPRVDFPEGLERTVRWYCDNRDWTKNIRL